MHSELMAVCLASMGGNINMDVTKISSSVSELLDSATRQKLPYIQINDASDSKPGKEGEYDLYFEQLRKMTEELKSKSGKSSDDKKGPSMSVSIQKTI